ncbi:MAG TPA: hydantoinase B/oxoprolinase family protein [Gemmatimonadales bacterium]|jgi:N-methylhydantoinase B
MTLDAIGLQVMAHAFAGIAEEMGALLVASALSPNVRERRDSSAALFTDDGVLIAQAAHIPVHLGAMPEAVAAVRGMRPDPGDTFILNDPYTGGTHLPDITMVHAIQLGDAIGGYTVVRAHHSDVGGSTPGSMPSSSRELFEEGLIIPPTRWATAQGVRADIERLVLANVRTPDIRRGDLAAQHAACVRGADRLRELVARVGHDHCVGAVADLLAYAEQRSREAVARAVADGVYEADDYLEGDGVTAGDLTIRVRVTVRGGGMEVDFTGTDPEGPGNVNCPLAVTRSAVLFVLRCLVDQDIPTNGGMHRVVSVLAPPGSLVNARWPRAVAAGNVETSQRIADVLFLALGEAAKLPAQGQGTMNNVVMGGDGWTYYETLGGGQGGSARGPGPSGVHVGMSNTRNTPIEVFEMEYPLRIERYALRDGSGGAGRAAGGDGVVRAYRALAPIHVSLITERRRHAPRGTQGGSPGKPGRNRLNDEELAGRAAWTMRPGDLLTIETPGGGGWGADG